MFSRAGGPGEEDSGEVPSSSRDQDQGGGEGEQECQVPAGQEQPLPTDDLWEGDLPPQVAGGGLQGQVLQGAGGLFCPLQQVQEQAGGPGYPPGGGGGQGVLWGELEDPAHPCQPTPG